MDYARLWIMKVWIMDYVLYGSGVSLGTFGQIGASNCELPDLGRAESVLPPNQNRCTNHGCDGQGAMGSYPPPDWHAVTEKPC